MLSWTDVGRIKSKTIEWVLVFSALITLSLNAGWLVWSQDKVSECSNIAISVLLDRQLFQCVSTNLIQLDMLV